MTKERRRLLVLFFCAFGLRAGAALIRHNPWLGGDSHAYVQMAEWLREGSASNILGHPPTYPFFLVWVYVLPFHSIVIALLAQACVSAFSAIATYHLTAKWTSPTAGLAAASIVALDPFQIYFSSLFLSETLFAFLMLGGFWALIGLQPSSHPARGALSGFIFALSALCRTILSPFLPLLALSIFFLRRATFLRSAALVAAFVCGIALPMALWSGYLHHRTGHWIFVSPQKGWNCYEGLNPNFDQPQTVRQWQLDMYHDAEVHGLKNQVQIDHYFWQKTLSTVERRPAAAFLLMVRKFFKFWRFWPYFPYALRERIISAIFMTFLIPLALYGLCLSWKDPRAFPWPAGLFASFIALYSIANTITWTEIRYRVPIHPIIAIFSGIGLARVISYIKRRPA